MRFTAIISLLAVFVIAGLWVALFGWPFSISPAAHHGNGGGKQPQTSALISHERVNTNLTAGPASGFYLGKGGRRVYIDYATPDPLLRSLIQSVMESSSDPNAKGKEIFMRICAACHQRDGAGKDGVAPPLVGSEWALAPDGGPLARIVLNGMAGRVEVEGRSWNLAMPPWRENLDDDQVAVVLTYVRSALGTNHAAAITPDFVAAARQNARSKPETAAELRVSDR